MRKIKTAYRDTFANPAVVDGTIVAGQNQNAEAEVARKMMKPAGPGKNQLP